MGLDIHMVQTPHEVPPGYVSQYDGQPEYFRVNAAAVPLLVSLIGASGVLVEEELPIWPDRPPPGLTIERLEALEDQGNGGEPLDNALGLLERRAWTTYKTALEQALARRASTQGKVPAYKLRTSDGWLVSPEECTLLAQSLTSFLPVLQQKQLDEILAPYEHERRQQIAYYKAKQGFVPLGMDGPPISLEEAREWLAQFAAYNELAARHGGYRVL